MQQADLLNQRLLNPNQTVPTEEEITYQSSSEEEDQETTTPVYTIISVPFLARSYLPTSSVQQRKLKTNGLVKTKPTVKIDRIDGQTIKLYPDQKNTSAPSNLSNQQRRQQSNKSTSSQLNTSTVQNIHKKSGSTLKTTVCNNINQLNTTAKSSNTTPTSLTSTTRTPVRTDSAKMMGIHLPGIEFQDMNLIHPIAAVEELMAPVCLDDYITINNNNNSDLEANNGTFTLDELNEMTFNHMNENFAEQQQTNEKHDESFMEEVPEDKMFNIIRQPHSEELISLTQPSMDYDFSESLFEIDYLNTNSDDSLENSYAISPGSPVPTVNDCIATSELHTNKYETFLNSTMPDDETTCQLVNLSELSPNQSEEQYSGEDEKNKFIMQLLDTLSPSGQQNLKRSSDHLSDIINVGAKKTRLNLPISEVIGDTLIRTVPDTPEVCNMVVAWSDDYEASMHSHTSIHSGYDSAYSPEGSILGQLNYPQTFENPPSVASSLICEEPSSYATPSPSNSSNFTSYTTNPNSPAVSTYSNGTGKKPRGRPPKQHSELPDPVYLSTLTGNDRKRYEDRCKNNEASRQSRQKNKQKLQELEAEEHLELNKNHQLKEKIEKLDKTHDRLKSVLQIILKERNSVE